MCRRAPTVDRLSLLGGAYKRLARIEAEGPARLEALVNMAEHYRLAFVRRREAYAFTHWQVAELLAGLRGERTGGQQISTVLPEFNALQREVGQRNADDPGFSDSITLADLQLLRLLFTTPAGGQRRRAAASELADTADVINAYREAISRGASPRETSSVAEHIAFLLDLWLPADKARYALLKQIQENLS